MLRLPRATTTLRSLVTALAVGLTAGSLVSAHSEPDDPSSFGSTAKGQLSLPLYRGNVVPFELTVAPTPNNCSGVIDLKLDWDESLNQVRLRLDGKRVLYRHPSVDRTEGVDFFPNPFLPEPEDVVNGRYQFWIVTPGELLTFWYSGTTLDLLGSDLDFASPPANAIPVPLPTLRAVGSPFFQPEHDGDLHFQWNFAYDRVTRGDLPQYGHHLISFPPPNLCQANPYRFDLSTARPYVSKPLPASEALAFSDYLRGGLLFDTTIDPPQYFADPPLTTFIATYSGASVISNAIPKDWTFDIEAAFMNIAPPIRKWEGAGSCQKWFKPIHTKGLNFCPAP